MVESLVIVLREGVEAALVVGIILAFLSRTGREGLRGRVFSGLALAVLMSLALALVFEGLGLDPENEYLEGALLGVGGIFVASMVVWVWRSARHLRKGMERRLETMTRPGGFQGLGLFLFTFFMVFREGVETVLFLFALTLGQFQPLHLLGATLGIALAVLFAIFFIRGTLRVDLARFFAVTGLVLLVLAVKLLAGSAHEFAEVGLLPMSSGVMRVLGYFVRDSTSTVILMALIALPLLAVLWGVRRAKPIAGSDAVSRRRWLAERRREAVWRGALVVASVFILLAMGSIAFSQSDLYDPQPQPVAITGDAVVLDTAIFEAGKLYKFSATVEGTEVLFLVYAQKDGRLSTVLDACQICGPQGYMQEGEFLICKNCNAPINTSTLGLGGGCDPLPLPSRVVEGKVVIPVSGLKK
ncbi:MAG: Fe-S-containing protein [Chloroflexota bacterium]